MLLLVLFIRCVLSSSLDARTVDADSLLTGRDLSVNKSLLVTPSKLPKSQKLP